MDQEQNQSTLTDSLEQAEGLILQGQDDAARELLARLAEDAEEYVDRNCAATESDQWFSFPTIFDRLCYRRVERDPRTLHDVGEPLDRLYADLALACVRTGDYNAGVEALKQAVRWNPMNCGYRLDLADLYRTNGDMQEYLALTYSCFERASEGARLSQLFRLLRGAGQAAHGGRRASRGKAPRGGGLGAQGRARPGCWHRARPGWRDGQGDHRSSRRGGAARRRKRRGGHLPAHVRPGRCRRR